MASAFEAPGLGIFSWFGYQLPSQERMRMIKEAGFDATSLWWGPGYPEDKHRQPEAARQAGLDVDYIHAPCDDPNALWLDGIDGDDYLNVLRSCIEDCRVHEVPTVVVHITQLYSRPPVTPIGMDRVKRLLDCAEKSQVNLALENMNSIPHLDSIYANLQSDRLGFCYDSGHEYYNHPDADCLSRYGDKLFAIHLDDNFGDNDTHLLPGDGGIDWESVRQKLKACRPLKYLSLEVDFNKQHPGSQVYRSLSAAEFLARAHQMAQAIAKP